MVGINMLTFEAISYQAKIREVIESARSKCFYFEMLDVVVNWRWRTRKG